MPGFLCEVELKCPVCEKTSVVFVDMERPRFSEDQKYIEAEATCEFCHSLLGFKVDRRCGVEAVMAGVTASRRAERNRGS